MTIADKAVLVSGPTVASGGSPRLLAKIHDLGPELLEARRTKADSDRHGGKDAEDLNSKARS